jgi:hypothetical protein
MQHGRGALSLDPRSFTFDVAQGSPKPDTLLQAFSRYFDIIFGQHSSDATSPKSPRALLKLVVTLGSPDEEVGAHFIANPLQPLHCMNSGTNADCWDAKKPMQMNFLFFYFFIFFYFCIFFSIFQALTLGIR